MLRKAGVRLSDIALRASGRFSVMMATRSRITHSNSSVPVSILVSLVMIPPSFSLSSLRGAKRRSNPASFLSDYGLLRCARNDGDGYSP
jgi:hypothetical protein